MKIKKIGMNLILGFFSLFLIFVKKNPNKISFISLESNQLEGDFKLLAEELERRKKFEIHYELFKFEKSVLGYFKYAVACIRQLFVIHSSGLVVLDFNNYVVSNFKRSDVKVIQVWHATGAIKKFGNLTERDYVIQNYDYVIVNGEAFVPIFAEAFGVEPSHVKVTGIPKTDLLFDKQGLEEKAKAFLEKHPQLSDKKIILYAPTFRGRLMTDFKEVFLDVETLQKELGDEYAIVYKLHPLLSERHLPQAPGIVEANQEDLFMLMEISDWLISDYSALVLDYLVFEKPMVFYVPDLEEYRQMPGIVVDYENEIPGAICKETESVKTAVLGGYKDWEKHEAFGKRYFPYRDGNSTKRVVDFMEEILTGRIEDETIF